MLGSGRRILVVVVCSTVGVLVRYSLHRAGL